MTDLPLATVLINRLFETHLNPETGELFTNMDVVVASRGALSPSHIHGLRTGRIKNPTRDTLSALCRVFKVSPIYFFPDVPDVELQAFTAD